MVVDWQMARRPETEIELEPSESEKLEPEESKSAAITDKKTNWCYYLAIIFTISVHTCIVTCTLFKPKLKTSLFACVINPISFEYLRHYTIYILICWIELQQVRRNGF